MSDSDLCAVLEYEKSQCGGWGRPARSVYVRNKDKDKRVRTTIKVTSEFQGRTHTFQRTRRIAAGGRTLVGCTVSSPGVPYTLYKYKVIGCEVLR